MSGQKATVGAQVVERFWITPGTVVLIVTLPGHTTPVHVLCWEADTVETVRASLPANAIIAEIRVADG